MGLQKFNLSANADVPSLELSDKKFKGVLGPGRVKLTPFHPASEIGFRTKQLC